MTGSTFFHCPSCQAKLRLPLAESGTKKIRCPKCKSVFIPFDGRQPESEDTTRPPAAQTQGQPAPGRVPSKSRKQPRRLSRAALVAVLVAFLVILGGSAAAWLYFSGYWLVILGNPAVAGKQTAPRQLPPGDGGSSQDLAGAKKKLGEEKKDAPPGTVPVDDAWIQDFAGAKKKAAEEKKDILLSFEGSDWCLWCQKMDKEIRALPEFQNKAGESFVLVKVDFPNFQPARSRVKDPVANQQLLDKFNVTSYPTMILTDAGGNAYGAFAGFPQGGLASFLRDLDKLRQVRIERDQLLAAVDQAAGTGKLHAAQRAFEFLDKKMLWDSLKQQLPVWMELAQRFDPKNEHGFVETFFAADWKERFRVAPAAGLPPLLREMEEWKKKYGRFKDKEKEAVLCLATARGKAELEDFEGAFLCLAEGLKLEPKNEQIRKGLQFGDGLALTTGTAFAVSDQGHYLTNFHVVPGSRHIFLQIPDQKQLLRARLVAQNPDLDAAVVQIDVPKNWAVEPLRVAADHAPQRGEQVGTLGFPLATILGHVPTLTQGPISSPTDPANRDMIKLDVKVNPGNSGGPLCDTRGNVIGMVTARTLWLPNNYGLAVPSKDIASFLKANHIPFRASEPSKTTLPWDAIDRRISPAVAMVIKGWPLNPATKDLGLDNGSVTEESKLDFSDGRDPAQPQSFAKIFSVKLERGKRYQIEMTSKELDSFLRLEDANRKRLLEDDGRAGGHDSRIFFDCPSDGTYKIFATTYSAGRTGNFVLKVVTEGKQ
jgi:thiol-disulfide isomerase/thioredoxin